MRARLQEYSKWLGRVGIAFLLLLVCEVALGWVAPASAARIVVELALFVTGVWLAVRLLRRAAPKAVWRLRNRLLVTYLFISVVPTLLILALAINGGELLSRQVAVYLVTSELDRRIDQLQSAADSIVRTEPSGRPVLIERMIQLFYEERYPGIEVLLRDSGHVFKYPANAALTVPLAGWDRTRGVLLRSGHFYLWCYEPIRTGSVTITVPLTREFLAALVPNLGVVDFGENPTNPRRITASGVPGRMPPAYDRLDNEFTWWALVPTAEWDHPGGDPVQGFLVVRSRVSAVLGAVFNRKADLAQGTLVLLMLIGAGIFFVVEIISVIIGITMTRTITGAVHRLYLGTQRVIEGDFSHRIEVKGKDQLAELSLSFNQMTANIERLLVVAKEKERLQSEIEIAREVQNQLYPRQAPEMRTLRLSAVCQPARMVSGDYYDYEMLRDSQIALAIGDVAGKGISAALLMATLQSSLRMQLQLWTEIAAAAGSAGGGNGARTPPVSTARVVGRLNTQLNSYTAPEKYATFCLGVYDELSGSLTYTNAGHLPPVLVREGVPQRLDVSGTVVGAFPFSTYDQGSVDLRSGDLLAFFTDGLTEPENEYGEMFGEDRLVDLIVRNAHRSGDQIIELVLSSVHQWTASEELQDDMTILIARRA